MYAEKIQTQIKETNQSINSLNLKKKKYNDELKQKDIQLDALTKENKKVIAGYNNDNPLSHLFAFLSLAAGIFVGIEAFKLAKNMFILFSLAIGVVAGFIAFSIIVFILYSIIQSRYKKAYLKYTAEKEQLESINYDDELSEIDRNLSQLSQKAKVLEKDLHYADLYDMPHAEVEDLCRKYIRIKSSGFSSEYSEEVLSALEDAFIALDSDGKYTATDILSTAYEDEDAPVLDMTYKVAYSGAKNGNKALKNYIYDRESWIAAAIKRGNYTDSIELATALVNAGDPVAQDLLDIAKQKQHNRECSVSIDSVLGRMERERAENAPPEYVVELEPVIDVPNM